MTSTRKLFTGAATLVAAIVVSGDPGLCQQAKSRSATATATAPAGNSQARPVRKTVRKIAKPSTSVADNVMRGRDTTALIAMLPWWRAGQWHGVQELDEPVLAIAGAYLGMPPSEVADAVRLADTADAVHAYAMLITDPGELNELDLAATAEPEPANQSWLHALLAMFGGAFAAASAARFLFV